MRDFYLISVDQAESAVLNKIHEAIKEHTQGYWHRQAALWIVEGLNPQKWRDVVAPFINAPLSVLVLKLPREGDRGWAYRGVDAKTKTDWMHTYYEPDRKS